MSEARSTWLPPVGLGQSSIILGAVGQAMFIVPILSIPISVCGAVLGLTGILLAIWSDNTSLRLSLAGVALSGFAVLSVFAIWMAPNGYFIDRSIFPRQPLPMSLRFVPPPAPFECAPLMINPAERCVQFGPFPEPSGSGSFRESFGTKCAKHHQPGDGASFCGKLWDIPQAQCLLWGGPLSISGQRIRNFSNAWIE
jgi:hypothetical protein